MTDDIRDPKLYETWSEEDLTHHVAELKKLLQQRRGDKPEANKAFLTGLFDPNNANFLGSGLTFEEWFATNRLRDFQESFVQQDRREKKRRLNLIVLMSAELVKIREVSRFATAQAESAIEAVIEGDWRMLKEWAGHFTFEEEGPDVAKQYGPLWNRLRELCVEVFDTRPGAPPPEPSETRH